MSARKVLLFVVSATLLLAVSPAFAADLSPQQERAANEIFQSILSPFCPGRALGDCPSSSATELREKIEERLAHGESVKEIKEYLYSVYGDEINSVPLHRGFGQVAWYTPVAFLLGGLACALLWLRAKKTSHSDLERPAGSLSPEMESRIQAELDDA